MGTSPALGRPKFVLGKRFSLANNSEYNEAWVEALIKQNPSMLGLGDKVEYLSSQIRNSNGGRLDLLLKDDETIYSVELMLGSVDETHIVRCLDYWIRNQTRRQFQDYDHVAVLVAEHVLGCHFTEVVRFLSSRANLVVIELAAIQVEEHLTLTCTTIFEGNPTIEDDVEPEDGTPWPPDSMALAKDVLEIIRPNINEPLELNLRKYDIGLKVGNRVRDFIIFVPRREFLTVYADVPKPEDWAKKLGEAGITILRSYEHSVSFRLTQDRLKANRDLIQELCAESAKASFDV